MEKKSSVAMTLVIASMWVTGCSSAEGEQTAAGAETPGAVSTGKEARQAFVFESGTLEIGDFDPQALGDDLFDPCTEISAAEFAAAGFENVEPADEVSRGLNPDSRVCFFTRETSLVAEALIASPRVTPEDHSIPSDLGPSLSSSIPGLVTYAPNLESGLDCFAEVVTLRGALTSAATGRQGVHDLDTVCHYAVENLESLWSKAPESK